MKCYAFFVSVTLLLLASNAMFAQQGTPQSSTDAFWVAYWAHPRVALFGSEQEAFNNNMREIMFPWNEASGPTDPTALDANVQWLKDHPNVRFYVEGYASSRGELVYNLALSQRRANWVKDTLVSKGIPESRIVLVVGWGQLYPVCPELVQECWDKNRLVRFSYVPD
jgi:outer membrane protein OmpA-like peptidoglycan-associated protein